VNSPFLGLDFLYSPTSDVEGDGEQLTKAGAQVVFAIEAFGTRVWQWSGSEIPHGPGCAFRTPGGQRLAI
jgi:hypothetical protein